MTVDEAYWEYLALLGAHGLDAAAAGAPGEFAWAAIAYCGAMAVIETWFG